MPTTLAGAFAYSLQGFIHALNHGKTAAEKPRDILVTGVAERDNDLLSAGNIGVFKPSAERIGRDFPAIATITPPNGPDPAPTGYYPVSEQGLMVFRDDGTVSDSLCLNVAGYSDATECAIFAGRYLFNGPSAGLMGAITIRLTKPAIDKLVWDYTFLLVGPDQILFAAAGRFPRPGVLTGIMWRMDFGGAWV